MTTIYHSPDSWLNSKCFKLGTISSKLSQLSLAVTSEKSFSWGGGHTHCHQLFLVNRLHGWIVIGQGGMVLNWDRRGLGWILGGSFYTEGGDTLEQVAQGGCGCPIPGGIQGQAGCGSGQPGLVVGNLAHSRGVETTWSLRSFSTQAILWVYDSLERLVGACWEHWGFNPKLSACSGRWLLCLHQHNHYLTAQILHYCFQRKSMLPLFLLISWRQ